MPDKTTTPLSHDEWHGLWSKLFDQSSDHFFEARNQLSDLGCSRAFLIFWALGPEKLTRQIIAEVRELEEESAEDDGDFDEDGPSRPDGEVIQ